jgi:hypothetical protein
MLINLLAGVVVASAGRGKRWRDTHIGVILINLQVGHSPCIEFTRYSVGWWSSMITK